MAGLRRLRAAWIVWWRCYDTIYRDDFSRKAPWWSWRKWRTTYYVWRQVGAGSRFES